ncbi:MAG TPA: hypothetical protein VGF69_21485 [Thermoanaerobaculia bacterium]
MPDRRRGFRILTLKNAGWFALSVTVLFIIYSTYMEHRSRGDSTYGRLYERRIAATRPPAPPAPLEVITEAPERPVVRRDVLLNRQDEAPLGVTSTAAPAPAAPQPVRLRRDGDRVTISGGTEGVRVDVQPAPPAAAAPPPG